MGRHVLLIDVFCFSAKKSQRVPSFRFIRFDLCEISKIVDFVIVLYRKCIEMCKKNVFPFRFFAVFKNSARKMEQNSEGKHAGCVAYGGTFLLDMHLQVCVWSETD